MIGRVWNARELRYRMVRSFLDALAIACTPTNIERAFEATGIAPIDVRKPLNSGYIVPNAIPPARQSMINNKVLTDANEIPALFQAEYNRPMTPQDWNVDIVTFMRMAIIWQTRLGKILSQRLVLLCTKPNGELIPVHLL